MPIKNCVPSYTYTPYKCIEYTLTTGRKPVQSDYRYVANGAQW